MTIGLEAAVSKNVASEVDSIMSRLDKVIGEAPFARAWTVNTVAHWADSRNARTFDIVGPLPSLVQEVLMPGHQAEIKFDERGEALNERTDRRDELLSLELKKHPILSGFLRKLASDYYLESMTARDVCFHEPYKAFESAIEISLTIAPRKAPPTRF